MWRPGLQKMLEDIRNYWKYFVALGLYAATSQLLFGAFCPVVIVTGVPCPGCGMTRAIFFFITGQWEKGWRMNPLGLCWVALALYFCIARYFFGRRPKECLQIGGVIAVCMAFVYLYRMYCFFPEEEPLIYRENNVLEWLMPGYGALIQRGIIFLKGLRL